MDNYNELTIVDELDKFIKYETKVICDSLLNEMFSCSDFFDSMYIYNGNNYEHGNSFTELKSKFGIYFFFINENIELSYKEIFEFNECASGGKFKRYMDTVLHKEDCLYLGSSTSESLYTRLNQHFDDKDSPASLHLSLKKRRILKRKVKIYAFPVKNKKIKNIDVLLKAIEKELHNIYKPLVGSNRV